MKIRIFKRLVDGVFHVRVQTEDWSERDRCLMIKYGEPELNLGGTFIHEDVQFTLDDVYARIMTESPFTRKFDSRDLGTVDRAKAIATAWATEIESRLAGKVAALRENEDMFTTEYITEY